MKKRDRNLHKIRKRNARIFPIYKMFSWDLLFFYPIQFLFYTITKGINTSQILIANSIFLLVKAIAKIPAVHISNKVGSAKSIVIGNCFMVLHTLFLIIFPGFAGVIIANIMMALGFAFKELGEDELLFDSVSTKGGSGLYSKINYKGTSLYYLLDGMASLASGYFFLRDNYLPIYISLAFIIIATLISLGFGDIHPVDKKKVTYKKRLVAKARQLRHQRRDYFKVVLGSSRLRSFIIFNTIYYSLFLLAGVYVRNIFLDLGVSEINYAIVFAITSIVSGLVIAFTKFIEKAFKNKTLTIMSMSYSVCCIILGIVTMFVSGKGIIAFSTILIIIMSVDRALWYAIKYKYLMHFTLHKDRNPITFVSETLGCLGAAITSIIGSIIVEFIPASKALTYTTIVFFILLVISILYMRTRFGLKPSKYKKEDIRLGI